MSKITTIGSALVDVFIQSPQFFVDQEGSLNAKVSGGKLAVDSFALKTGGGASNTAVGFSRFGHEAAIISELGRDELAELIVADLRQEKVNIEYLVQEKKEETGGSVILIDSDTGDRTVLTHRGASSMLDPQDIPEQAYLGSDLLHISSLSGQLEALQKVFEGAEAQRRKGSHINLSWNPGTADIALVNSNRLTVIGVKYLFVNKQEWEMLQKNSQDLKSNCHMIIITDGVNGGEILQDGQPVMTYQAEVVTAVDSTGAGDAYAVGFLSAQLNGKDLAESVEWGKKNAASVVQFIGAKQGLLRNDQLPILQ